MSRDPKGSLTEKDGSTPPMAVSNESLVVTVWNPTRTCSWKVEFPSNTTSQELIRELVTSLKLPSSEPDGREIPYILGAVSGKQNHRFTNVERVGDYLAQNPNAFLVLLLEITAG